MIDFKKILKTEKTFKISSSGSTCVFLVNKDISKPKIKSSFEKLFSVKVEKINTLNTKPKFFLFKNKASRTSSFKKVFLKLKPGFSMPLSFNLNNQNVEK